MLNIEPKYLDNPKLIDIERILVFWIIKSTFTTRKDR